MIQQTISPESLGTFFALAPLVLGLLIIGATYFYTRNETVPKSPAGQTFACAGCGRRGTREHMLPRAHAGAVSWYCPRCSGSH